MTNAFPLVVGREDWQGEDSILFILVQLVLSDGVDPLTLMCC